MGRKTSTLILSTLFASGATLGACADMETPATGGNIGVEQEALVGDPDLGVAVENTMRQFAFPLFGVSAPLAESPPVIEGPVRAQGQSARDLIATAEGLTPRFASRDAANDADMMALWPDQESPTHLIYCAELERQELGPMVEDGTPKLNPSVQSIDLATGKVRTILRGLDQCSAIHRTPWGTILATEERPDGAAYEILEPLKVRNAAVVRRGGPGQPVEITSQRIAQRPSLPLIAWEGLTILSSGVVLATDDLMPGTVEPGARGGSIYKFVPSQPRTDTGGIQALDASPLAKGKVYALQVSCREDRQQVGQGCDLGNAAWIEVQPAQARTDAMAAGATGYGQPSDVQLDPMYANDKKPDAVRFCWSNHHHPDAARYGEVLCAVDIEPATADAEQRTVTIVRFIDGDPSLNHIESIAFQPRTGNLYVVEDAPGGDVFACLRDKNDRDLKSDGCIRVLSANDATGHLSGLTFTADGTVAFIAIQGSNDERMPMRGDVRTDDVFMITGFVAF